MQLFYASKVTNINFVGRLTSFSNSVLPAKKHSHAKHPAKRLRCVALYNNSQNKKAVSKETATIFFCCTKLNKC